MSIGFTKEKWDTIIHDSNLWWHGKLGRPLIQGWIQPPQQTAGFSFQSYYPLEEPAEIIIDDWQVRLSSMAFLGDAYPHIWPNFGPGVVAAFLGAELKNGRDHDTVWFEPRDQQAIKDIQFDFDPEHKWFLRIKEIISAAIDRWQGSVQIGMPDLGGTLDILSTFRPGEKLLLDLYDEPDEVKRLIDQCDEIWWQYFQEFQSLTAGVNPGYTTWAEIFSQAPHYMLQCDVAYMIGPDMFEKHVKPSLQKACDRLTNAFYHLDGPGQLVHLDSVLDIESLRGIQWIPGAGSPDITQWPDVYRKITDAGKKIQLISTISDKPIDETMDIITDQIGRADHIVYRIYTGPSNRGRVEKVLTNYS